MSNTLEEFEPKSLTLQDNIEESEVEIKEFPNEAYADLMTLVTKHNLNSQELKINHQGEKSYAEQNSGNWWKYAEASIPSSACILSLILYSDATTADTLGKSSLHPIYISLRNIPIWRRNKEDAK
ncbi:hypothetical protein Glove_443g12 [Diversispora epigaea]|uniref:Uncharacterized protein n=1 Tax=Diversispora epigaea TaxID=1348612 RepID=A0A397GV49_9GLOM|nr:hypothetical protein Glove_443g12 [Diversispora epigaea]